MLSKGGALEVKVFGKWGRWSDCVGSMVFLDMSPSTPDSRQLKKKIFLSTFDSGILFPVIFEYQYFCHRMEFTVGSLVVHWLSKCCFV